MIWSDMVEPITAIIMAYLATSELNKISPDPVKEQRYNKVMTKPIDKTFERAHCTYTLLDRKDSICLYKYVGERSGVLQGYEVVKLYTDKTGHEYFPGTSLWGTNGFTYLPEQYDKAHNKFEEMHKASLVKKAKKSK